jgi:hypothetical protein
METINRVHNALPARYRPASTETAGLSRFLLLNQAGEQRLLCSCDNSDFVINGLAVDYFETHLPFHGLRYRLLKAAGSGGTAAAVREETAARAEDGS